MPNYSCTRVLEFDAAHRVPLHVSKCKSLHGHRYRVEVTCVAEELSKEGFVVDFGVIKSKLGTWIDDKFDHTTLVWEDDEFMMLMAASAASMGLKPFFVMTQPPTAEAIAKYLFEVAITLLSDDQIEVTKLTVWETPNCRAEWPA